MLAINEKDYQFAGYKNGLWAFERVEPGNTIYELLQAKQLRLRLVNGLSIYCNEDGTISAAKSTVDQYHKNWKQELNSEFKQFVESEF